MDVKIREQLGKRVVDALSARISQRQFIVSNSSGMSPHDLTDVLFYAHSDSEVSC
jgi:hypothetical protein